MVEEPKHTYPEFYEAGRNWEMDEAFRVLDLLKPGTLDFPYRMFLAGAITAALQKAKKRAESEGVKNDGARSCSS